MAIARSLILAAVLAVAAAAPGLAAGPQQCLSPEERRAAIAEHRAVPLARAMRAARRHFHGEVVRARLCQGGDKLVYVLTVLARDGKVTRAIVDAASGHLLGG